MVPEKLVASEAPRSIVLVRLAVGAVFLSEGIQKFLFPSELGAGRFARVGLPAPEVLGPLVGAFEIACGAAVLAGLLTRLAAIPLATIMLVAIASTKVPILLNKGFWTMAHEARTDWAMLLGSLYLVLAGAGPWSLDAALVRRYSSERRATRAQPSSGPG